MILPMPPNAGQVLVAFQLRAFLGDRLLQFANALVQAANLRHDHAQFDPHQLIKGKGQYRIKLFLTR